MRHRVYGRHLNRNIDERNSLFKGLIIGLINHGFLETTESKAKAIKGLFDKVVTAGKKNNQAAAAFLLSAVNKKESIKKLVGEIAPRFSGRQSGFLEMVKLGRRLGDGAMMVRLSLTKEAEKEAIVEKSAAGSEEKEENSSESGDKKVTKHQASQI